MSGLTKLGKEILDFHDSGMMPDLIALVLKVPESIVRATIGAYVGTAASGDVLEEIDGGTLFAAAPTRSKRASAHL